MSNMWCYLRLNPSGPRILLLLEYCDLLRLPWWSQSRRPHSCGWEVRFPLKGGGFHSQSLWEELDLGSGNRDSEGGLHQGIPWRQRDTIFVSMSFTLDLKQWWTLCESDCSALSGFLPMHTTAWAQKSFATLLIPKGLWEALKHIFHRVPWG